VRLGHVPGWLRPADTRSRPGHYSRLPSSPHRPEPGRPSGPVPAGDARLENPLAARLEPPRHTEIVQCLWSAPLPQVPAAMHTTVALPRDNRVPARKNLSGRPTADLSRYHF